MCRPTKNATPIGLKSLNLPDLLMSLAKSITGKKVNKPAYLIG